MGTKKNARASQVDNRERGNSQTDATRDDGRKDSDKGPGKTHTSVRRGKDESLLQSKRDTDVTVRQSSEVERIRDFLEKGLERPVEPRTLRTVLANTKERKAVRYTTEEDLPPWVREKAPRLGRFLIKNKLRKQGLGQGTTLARIVIKDPPYKGTSPRRK
jgi:hypothetical protein